MSITVSRGETDAIIERMTVALEPYRREHPNSQIELYRQHSVSVRLMVIDPGFAGQTLFDRNEDVWAYLNDLSEADLSHLSTLVLLTPEEVEKSRSNLEFEDSIPSEL